MTFFASNKFDANFFSQGKEYFRRITKILAAYTDLELCGSVSHLEWDTEMANRIQLIYKIFLEVSVRVKSNNILEKI